jgi:hypothetical protein
MIASGPVALGRQGRNEREQSSPGTLMNADGRQYPAIDGSPADRLAN